MCQVYNPGTTSRREQVLCKRGHRLDDPTNVKVWRGHRTCLTCKRDWNKAQRRDPLKGPEMREYWRTFKSNPVLGERMRAATRAYLKRRMQEPEYRAKRAAGASASRLKREYGLTLEAYEGILASQGGVCAICQGPSKYRHRNGSLSGRFAVDHDHSTGRIRGLLCDQCNRMIGHLDKDQARALAAIRYLGL